jgi:hypothetical protein
MAKGSVDRRDFLKGAAVTGAAALVPSTVAAESPQVTPAAQSPGTAAIAGREADPVVDVEALTTDRPGGDF